MNKFSVAAQRANVNQLLQSWVAGLWLGRDTLTDEHRVATSAGVMRSRAVRRLQEFARWVLEVLQAMLLSLWVPHLKLSGLPRPQRLAHEEPLEVGTLQRFIATPAPTTKREPKPADKFVTLLGDAEQSTKRQCHPHPGPSISSYSCATDTSMHVPGQQVPKLARQLSPAEREDSIPKAEVKHNVDDSRALQRKRESILDRRSKHYTQENRMSFQTWTSLVWRKRSIGRNNNNFSRCAGYKNKDWMDFAKCELWQNGLSRRSVLMQTLTKDRQSSRHCEVYSPLLQSTEMVFGDCHSAYHLCGANA